MGYFDSLKPERTTVATAPSNVVQLREGLHPYAAAIRDAWLARLDNVQRPWVHGAAWDTNCFNTARKLLELTNSPWSGYRYADAHSDYMAHAPHDSVWDKREKCWEQAQGKAQGVALPEPAPGAPLPDVTILDDEPVADLTAHEEGEFWSARPFLRHLHTFARARRVSPWAVLGVTLARVVVATPVAVALPPTVGSKASLNMFVGLVGPSGSGKGAAEAVSADAFDVGPVVSHNVGSGEGIAHGYMHRAKGGLEWNDETHAVLFSVPEIDSLAAQGDRRGATLMPQLRSGWTGEQLGFGYADPTKRILVPAHQYRLCMVAGIQPGRAACLLDDADGGTPQRFLWMPATDPDAPNIAPSEPTRMTWSPPSLSGLVAIGGTKVTVCDTAAELIDEARVARLRNTGDALDGHALLCRLKTAAALGIADGRYAVNDDDWELAGTVQAKSDATRAAVVHLLRSRAVAVNTAKAEAEAIRAIVVEEHTSDAAVRRACKTIMRRLHKGDGEDEWVPHAELRRALASRDRGHFEAALERLEEAAQISSEPGVQGKKYAAVKESK